MMVEREFYGDSEYLRYAVNRKHPMVYVYVQIVLLHTILAGLKYFATKHITIVSDQTHIGLCLKILYI